MSAKIHEAFGIDSFQDYFLWWDHFLGDQIKDEWLITVNGFGSVVDVIDLQPGGIARLTSGAWAGRFSQIDWNNFRSLLVSKNLCAEFRAKLVQVTDFAVNLYVFNSANSNIRFTYDSAVDTTWYIRTRSGVGDITTEDTGILADTDYHAFRITSHAHGGTHIHFEIDRVEPVTSPIPTDIPATYLQPMIFVVSRANFEKSLDLDYVVVQQEI